MADEPSHAASTDSTDSADSGDSGDSADSGAPTPRDVFDRCLRLGLSGRHDEQADLYAADGVMEFPFAPAGIPRRIEGREEIRRLLVALGARARATGGRIDEARSSLTVYETRDPEVVIVEIEAHGQAAAGAPFVHSYIQVYRVRDGAIVSLRDYLAPEVGASLVPLFAASDA